MTAGQLHRPTPTTITEREHRMTTTTIAVPQPEQVPLLHAAADPYPRLVRVGNNTRTEVRVYSQDTSPPRQFEVVASWRLAALIEARWVVEVASPRHGGQGVTWYRLTDTGRRALAEVHRGR